MKQRIAAACFLSLLAWIFTGPFLGIPVMLIFALGLYQESKEQKQTGVPSLADEGLDDENEWDKYNPVSVSGIALELRYTDVDGNKTSRIIDMHEFDPNIHGCVIKGHCRLRDDIRTFRGDRIDEVVDTATGEIIADIGAFLTEAHNKTKAKKTRRSKKAE